MNVKMLETRSAAPDGATVVRLLEGETYDLPEDLAQVYIDRGRAVAVDPAPVAEAAEAPPDGEPAPPKPAPRARSRKAQ